MNRVISLCGPKGSGKSTIAAWLVAERGFEEISLAKPLKAFARTIFGRVLSEEDCWGPSAVRERKFSSREKQELHRSFQARTTFLRLDAEGRQMLKDLFGERIGIDGSEIRAPALFGPREAAVAFQAAFEPFEEAFHSPRMILQRLGTEWGRKLWDEVWLNAVRRTVDSRPDQRFVIPDVRFVNEDRYLRDQLGAQPYWVEAGARIEDRPRDAHASEPTRAMLLPLCQGEIDNRGTEAELLAALPIAFPA